MSRTLDERIVSMQFDNAEFEKRISNTQQSLKKLDESLDFSNSKGVSSLSDSFKKLDLSGISSGIQFLEDRFSTLGIVGMRIIENLTDAALNFGKKIFDNTIGQIISGGNARAENIENAHFMLQGLMDDEKQVQEIMQIAQDSVTDTAYGYDQAAKAAANFVASGLSQDQLATSLKAIAGTSAVFNTDYSRLADIFQKVAAQGRVMGGELTQLSSYGINASATMAKFFNQVIDGDEAVANLDADTVALIKNLKSQSKKVSEGLHLTEGDIRQLASESAISFDLFSQAMSGAFGDQAKRANETVQGSLSNIRAALSRTGAMFKSPLIEQNGPMVQAFNALRIMINNINKELGPFADTYVGVMKKIYSGIASIADLETGEMILDVKSAMEGLKNILEGIKGLLQPIKEGFKGLFPEDLLGTVNEGIKKFETLTENFLIFSKAGSLDNYIDSLREGYKKVTDLTSMQEDASFNYGMDFSEEISKTQQEMQKLTNARMILNDIKEATIGIRDGFKIAKDALLGFVELIKISFGGIGGVGRSLLDLAANIGLFINNIKTATQETQFFHRIAEAIGSIFNALLRPAFKAISSVLGNISGKFYDLATDKVGVKDFFEKVASAVEKFADVVVNKGLNPAIDLLRQGLGWLGEKLAPLKDYFTNTKDAVLEFFAGFKNRDVEKVSTFTLIIDALSTAFSKLWEVVKKLGGMIVNGIKNAFGGLNAENLVDAGIFSFVTAGVVNLGKKLRELRNKGAWVETALTKFPTMLQGLAKTFNDFSNQLTQNLRVDNLKDIATAILMIAGAMFIVASIDPDRLFASFSVISGLLAEMVGILTILTKLNKADSEGPTNFMNGLNKLAKGQNLSQLGTILIKIAGSILILAFALKTIASIDADRLLPALFVLEVLLLSLAAVAMALSSENQQSMIKGSTALIALAFGVKILASAVKSLSSLSWEELAKGLAGVIVLLAALAGFAYLTKDTNLSGFGLSLIAMAAGMLLLTKSVKTLGEMDTNTLMQGLLSIVAALMGIGVALNMFPDNMVSIGFGLDLVAVGLLAITKVIKKLGEMSVGDLVKSILALTVALTAIGFAMNLMTGTLAGAAAMLVMSVALIAFGGALKIIASIPLLDLIKSILALTVGLAALALLSAVLTPFTLTLALLGAAILALGVGVAALAAGLSVLTVMGYGAITVLTMFLAAIIGMIPTLMGAIATGFVQMLTIFANSGAEILAALTTLVNAVLQTLIDTIPKLVELAVTIVVEFLGALGEIIPAIIQLGVDIIVAFLDAIIELVPKIVETGVTIVVSIIEGIAEMIGAVIQAAFDLIIALLNGIADAIRGNWGALLDAGKNIISAIWEGITGTFGGLWNKIKEKGHTLIEGIKEGLSERLDKIKQFFLDLPGKIKGWFQEKIQKAKEVGTNIIEGIKGGLSGGEGGLLSTIGGIGSRLLGKLKGVLGIKSPSRETAEMGKFLDQGLVNGLEKYSNSVNAAAEGVGEGALDTMSKSLSQLANADLDDLADPVIRPVLDLSEIQNGANSIENLLGGQYGVGLLGNLNGLSSIKSNSQPYAPTINMTVNGAAGQDVTELADIVMNRINRAIRSEEMVWA